MEPSTDWAANLKMFPEVPEEEEGLDRVGSNIHNYCCLPTVGLRDASYFLVFIIIIIILLL